MSEDTGEGSQPSKKRAAGEKVPTKVKITYPSDADHWSRFLPPEHGKWNLNLQFYVGFLKELEDVIDSKGAPVV